MLLMTTEDPYSIITCGNAKCRHYLDRSFRRLYPDPKTPKENIHTSIDDRLSAPLVYLCASCNHFTIIRSSHQTAPLSERAREASKPSVSDQVTTSYKGYRIEIGTRVESGKWEGWAKITPEASASHSIGALTISKHGYSTREEAESAVWENVKSKIDELIR